MRFCIDYYKGIFDEDLQNDGAYKFYRTGDMISEYFNNESDFYYRLHELERMDDEIEIDGTYEVKLKPIL